MRILCTGDVHIGRSSSKLPAALEKKAYPASGAWSQAVETAITRRVDLMIVSGDLVDQDNKYYEAIAPVEHGIARLAAAGIRLIAVAGNHDYGVLPRLAQNKDAAAFTLLGAGGDWQRETIVRDGTPVLHVDGWSFTSDAEYGNPLDTYDLEPGGAVPVLGVLHADAGASGGKYAPVPNEAFLKTGCAAWALGHIHLARTVHDGGSSTPLVFYPGSPQALAPDEGGAHGVTVLEIEPGRPATAAPVFTSRVRYERLEIDLADVADAEEFQVKVPGRIKDGLARQVVETGDLEIVSVRLRFVGRTALATSAIEREARSLAQDYGVQLGGGARAAVENFEIDTRPALDLEKIATGGDPPGMLAALLLKLDRGESDAEIDALVAEAHDRSLEAWRAGAYVALPDDDPTIEDSRRVLRGQTVRLLEELLAQKGTA